MDQQLPQHHHHVNDDEGSDGPDEVLTGIEAHIRAVRSKMSSSAPLDHDDLYTFLDPKQPELLRDVGGLPALARVISSDPERGLKPDVVEQNRETYGINRLPPAQFKSFLSLVWEAMSDRTLIMLSIAALISLIIGVVTEPNEAGWKDGVAVFVAVIIVVAITSINDYQKEKQFRRLNDVKNDFEVTAVRDGQRVRISVYDIVVGDIIHIDTGDVIPADGVFVEGESLEADESSATGESNTIKKGLESNRDPFFLSGTTVVGGSGQMMVLCVGTNSFHGRIMLALRTPDEDTPLQDKLSRLANLIGNFGIVTAIIIFLAQMIKYFAAQGSDVDSKDALNNVVDSLIIAISIVVVAVPEGLPLAVTIALAYSMKYMMKDNNLVRRLDACETMGGATTVCSDKTGTLTQNKMTVVQGVVGEHPFDLNAEKRLDINDRGESSTISAWVLKLVFEGLSVNSTAYETTDTTTNEKSFIGSKTETALLQFAQQYGQDYESYRKNASVAQMYTFSSAKKRMSCALRLDDKNRSSGNVAGRGTNAEGHYGPDLVAACAQIGIDANASNFIFYTKGAAEIIAKKCTHAISEAGSIVAIDADRRADIEASLEDFSSKSLRAIGFAFSFSSDDRDLSDDDEPSLILLGLVGLQDPLRPEIKGAVKACQEAGVVVRMVTGDAAGIARNIGANCGLYDESQGHICIEGPEFRHMQDEELLKILPNLRILARSSPTDKFKLVSFLQKQGDVVAVTGDGVNDGPALKKADVGFAMGLSGTEVAKEASTIVLLDDNFASIVNAIKWGRSVFDNIRKFLQFQLAVNFTAIIILLVAVLVDPEGNAENAPLKPVQLLWINLIMDSFAALALATEPATEALLKFKPFGRDEPLMTIYMGRRLIFQVIMQSITFLVILYRGEPWFRTEMEPLPPTPTLPPNTTTMAPDDVHVPQFSQEHYTVLFNAFVLSQLVNQFTCRKLRGEVNIFDGLRRHWIFLAVFVFALCVQVLIIFFGGSAIEVTRLDSRQWAGCVVVALFPLVWSTLFNLTPNFIRNERWYLRDRLSRIFCCSRKTSRRPGSKKNKVHPMDPEDGEQGISMDGNIDGNVRDGDHGDHHHNHHHHHHHHGHHDGNRQLEEGKKKSISSAEGDEIAVENGVSSVMEDRDSSKPLEVPDTRRDVTRTPTLTLQNGSANGSSFTDSNMVSMASDYPHGSNERAVVASEPVPTLERNASTGSRSSTSSDSGSSASASRRHSSPLGRAEESAVPRDGEPVTANVSDDVATEGDIGDDADALAEPEQHVGLITALGQRSQDPTRSHTMHHWDSAMRDVLMETNVVDAFRRHHR